MVRRQSGIAPRDTSRVYFTRHDTLLELVFVGRISARALERTRDDPTQNSSSSSSSGMLVDCEAMTTLEPDARAATLLLLARLRERGLRRLAGVAPFSGQRVALAALAFVAELELELFADRATALRACS